MFGAGPLLPSRAAIVWKDSEHHERYNILGVPQASGSYFDVLVRVLNSPQTSMPMLIGGIISIARLLLFLRFLPE